MQVGVIGVGAMGKNHVRVYSELKSVDEVSVCDLNTAAAEEIAQQHGATAYPFGRRSPEECRCRQRLRPDAVPCRYLSGRSLLQEKSVLIEKPICATAKEAHELMHQAPKGITVGVGHIERFNPIVAEIKKIIKKPLYVEMKRHNPASARVTGSSVVEDLMIHDIDILQNVFFPRPCGISQRRETMMSAAC